MIASASLLSEQNILNSYLKGNWPQIADLHEGLFHSLRRQYPHQPDYAIKSYMNDISLKDKPILTSSKYAETLLQAFNSLSKPIFLRGKQVYIEQEKFESWQQALTYVMPLPILAYYASKNFNENDVKEVFKLWFKQQSCLPSPYIPELNEVFKQGVSEHHLHIMGTTESDYIWQDALVRPKAIINSLFEASEAKEAKQQLNQLNYQISFGDMYHLLDLASVLRFCLLDLIQGKIKYHNQAELQELLLSKRLLQSLPLEATSIHPAIPYTGTNNLLINEAFLLYGVFCYLELSKSEIVARYLHIYLLIQSLFHRMLSQQLLDKGFQQFEKITKNELRETAEKKFEQRFKQISGMYNMPISLLEARFAPKNDVNKLRSLLRAVYNGYKKSGSNKLIQVSLTAHFIKQKDRYSDLYPCRHYLLRNQLEKQRGILLYYLKKNKEIQKKVIAIDAAGNELNASPDVFAPLYRQLRKDGFKHFTYHAGEDFKHLLSGMRQVYEAIVFLDLRSGDRIGHGTALGIDPSLWLKRAAKTQIITQGEWFETLLFTHHILLKMNNMEVSKYAYNLEEEIFRLSELIFKPIFSAYPASFTLQALKSSWRERWRNPLNNNMWNNLSNSTKQLCKAWHTASVYKEANKTIEVNTHILPESVYYKLQEYLLAYLCNKQIAIEILPTSNLRISYYQSYDEHHVHRWLSPTAKNRPVVIMGSDDPGIFSTNLFNEYAHIYISSKNNQDISSKNAVQLIQEIVENGKNYGFWQDSAI